MSFVSVRGVGVEYGGYPILERIGLDVDEGEFVTILGASGCGKSTFLRLLSGQEAPSRGSISVAGRTIEPEPGPDRGIVFQRYSVFSHLTVIDNLLLSREIEQAPVTGRLFGARRRKALAEAETMMERIGLSAARKRYPAQLSGGMQQRLALGQALMKRPKILMLDEPFGALDPGIRQDMHVLLEELWRENAMTIFMVTHDVKEAFALGTRLLVFDKLRHDPDAPDHFGATVTYDLPVAARSDRAEASAPAGQQDHSLETIS